MDNDSFDQIQDELEKKEAREKKQPMPQSGRSVFEIQKIIGSKTKDQNLDDKPSTND
jgi:hypothetical protein